MTVLCIRCDAGMHTEPSNANYVCGCSLKTCGCYGLRVRFEVKEGKK